MNVIALLLGHFITGHEQTQGYLFIYLFIPCFQTFQNLNMVNQLWQSLNASQDMHYYLMGLRDMGRVLLFICVGRGKARSWGGAAEDPAIILEWGQHTLCPPPPPANIPPTFSFNVDVKR